MRREKICIVTPDTLYGTLLKNIQFPSFESRVIKGLSQLKSTLFDFEADAFLIFMDHLDTESSESILREISSRHSKAQVFLLEGKQKATVRRLDVVSQLETSSQVLEIDSIEALDLALIQLRG